MRSYPMSDMRSVCADFDGHCGDQPCKSDCFIRPPDTEPKSGMKLLVTPRKFKSKLHKKMSKFEKAFDKTEGSPLAQARVNKSAESLQKKIDLIEGKGRGKRREEIDRASERDEAFEKEGKDG